MGWRDTIKTEEPVEAPKKSWRDTVQHPTEKPQAADTPPPANLIPQDSVFLGTHAMAPTETVLENLAPTAEAIARGGANASTLGFSDEIVGGAEGLYDTAKHALQSKVTDKGQLYAYLKDKYKENRDESRMANETARAKAPGAYLLGEVGGGVATALIPGMNLGKGAGILKTAAQSAGVGAVQGAGTSTAETLDGNLDDALDGAKWGGLLGAGGKILQNTAEAVPSMLDWLQRKANSRAVKSLDPILSQQEVLNRKDLVQKLGQELNDRGVTGFNKNVADMAPDIDKLLQEKGRVIGGIRDEVDDLARGAVPEVRDQLTVNTGDRLQRQADAHVGFTEGSVQANKDAARAFNKEAQNLAERPVRSVGDAATEMGTLDSSVIPYEKPMADWTPRQKAAKSTRDYLNSGIDDSIKAADKYFPTETPRLDQYNDAKGAFGLLKEGNKILDKSVSRLERNRDFSISDYMTAAAKAKDGGITQIAWAAANKWARENGNSTLASILHKAASDPGGLGKFTGILAKAAAKGNQSLAMTHQILMNKDNEYRKKVAESLEQERNQEPGSVTLTPK